MEAKMNNNPEGRGPDLESITRELVGLGLDPDHAARVALPMGNGLAQSVGRLCPPSPGFRNEKGVYRSMLHALSVVEGTEAAGVTEGDPRLEALAEEALRDNEQVLVAMGVPPSDAQWVIRVARHFLNLLPPHVMAAFQKCKLRPPTAQTGQTVIRGVVTAALRFIEQAIETAERENESAGETPCDPIQPSTGGTDPAPKETPPAESA